MKTGVQRAVYFGEEYRRVSRLSRLCGLSVNSEKSRGLLVTCH